MNGTLDADDLDAEFEKLQQEVASFTDENGGYDVRNGGSQLETRNRLTTKHVGDHNSKNLVSIAAKAVPSRPAWEQGLLERDLLDLQESAEIRKEAAAIIGDLGNASTNGKSKPSQNEAPPKGKWVWTGSRWEWNLTVSTDAVIPSADASINSEHASDNPIRETLAGPAGPTLQSSVMGSKHTQRKRSNKRMAAGEVWVDDSLTDWPENDFRIFVGDLAPDATDKELIDAFCKYKSFNMARIVKDKKAGKCRGYGFVSFSLGEDMVAALKEMNGKYVGSRPVKLKKSNWHKRNLTSKRRKELKLFRSISKPSW